MYQTNQKGLLTELQCQLAFTKVGIVLYQPITPDSKIDFIADINHKLYKIQCKTASVSANQDFIQITCIASGYHNPSRYTKEDVDFYYTYFNNKSYLIPFFEGKQKTLRFKPSNSQNQQNVTWAKDYELENILNTLKYSIQETSPTIISATLKEKKIQNKCSICGKPILKGSVYCTTCIHIAQRTVERPEREELKQMIRNTTFVDIGKKYSVSGNSIKKWCKAYNLPSTKREINTYTQEEWKNI